MVLSHGQGKVKSSRSPGFAPADDILLACRPLGRQIVRVTSVGVKRWWHFFVSLYFWCGTDQTGRLRPTPRQRVI